MTEDPQLNQAILAADVEEVRRLLSGGADANAVTEGRGYVSLDLGSGVATSGWTALMLAAYTGSRDIAALLLRHGVDPNTRQTGGATPLHCAVDAYDVEVVSLLLERGADPNFPDDEGITPLRIALDAENEDLAQILRSAGATE